MIKNKLRLTFLLLTFILMPAVHICAINVDSTKSILIITSYNPETRSISENLSEFMKEYNARGAKYSVIVESMNCQNLPEAHVWKARMAQFINKYCQGKKRPSLVVLLGVEANAAFFSQGTEITHELPVICGLRSRNTITLPPDNADLKTWQPASIDLLTDFKNFNVVAGTIYQYDVEKNIRLIKKLYPDTRTIAFLSDNTFGGLSLQSYVKKEMKKFPELKLQLLDGRVMSFLAVNDMIKKMPKHTCVLIGTWRIDCTNNYVMGSTTHLLCATNPQLRTFSLSSVGQGSWAIGGYNPDYRNVGQELADACIDFLSGKTSRNIVLLNGSYIFDYNRLKDFSIDKSRLPEGSEIINEPQTFFQQYKYWVYGVISFVILLVICLGIAFYYIIHINEMKKALMSKSRELNEAKDRAEDANRMKTSFIANMSHEIRTPLNAIVGFSDLIADTNIVLTDDERRNFVNVIQKNSGLLLHLINDILDLSSIESGRIKLDIQPCEIVQLCKSVLSTAECLNITKAKFQLEMPVEKFVLRTDEQRLRQVLINLLSNAAKCTKDGFIRLNFTIDEERQQIAFCVMDTGVGIPKDKAEKIFERFEKLNSFSQGTGLGLSICRMIVEQFGGKIWVDTNYTGGAKFVFTHSLSL
jgi:signal transduction histidine kinase